MSVALCGIFANFVMLSNQQTYFSESVSLILDNKIWRF